MEGRAVHHLLVGGKRVVVAWARDDKRDIREDWDHSRANEDSAGPEKELCRPNEARFIVLCGRSGLCKDFSIKKSGSIQTKGKASTKICRSIPNPGANWNLSISS